MCKNTELRSVYRKLARLDFLQDFFLDVKYIVMTQNSHDQKKWEKKTPVLKFDNPTGFSPLFCGG